MAPLAPQIDVEPLIASAETELKTVLGGWCLTPGAAERAWWGSRVAGGNARVVGGSQGRWALQIADRRGWSEKAGHWADGEEVIARTRRPGAQLRAPRCSPTIARRARLTDAASSAKSWPTRRQPRTRARRPPCLRRIRWPILRSTLGRIAR